MRKINTVRGLLGLALAFAATLPPSLPAQEPVQDAETTAMPPRPPSDASVQVARLSDVEGTVHVVDAGGQLFDQTRVNMPVLAGMQIKTGDDGRAEIEFPDGSVARVTPNSTLRLQAAASTGPGGATDATALVAAAGLTYFETPSDQGGSLSVQVGPDSVTLSANTLVRIGLDSEPAQVAILRGSAHFASSGGDVHFDLPANQTASIDLQSVMDYDVASSVSSDSWDAWNADRDIALSALAAGQTSARGDSANADDPGWNDLDYYGRWYDVPGYGMAWAPDNSGADFDPYGSGYWGYYTNVGYTWISAYPWGWLPYRCGQWNYFGGGSGWLWLPGGCSVHRWLPYAPVRRGPNGYHFPVHPVGPTGYRHSLTPVSRTPTPVFRLAGQPKLPARTLNLHDDAAQTIVATPYPVYSTFAAGPSASSRPAYNPAYNNVARPLGGGVSPVSPGRVMAPTVPVSRPYTPTPVARPAPPMSAPHYAAPRATPAPAAPSRPR